MSDVKKGPKVPCPACRKPTAWSQENPWRPFCSQRCRLIDLGEWLDEGYKINDPESTGKPFTRDPD